MEGHYWRFADPAGAWSVAVIAGICRAPDGPWAMVTLASDPGGFARTELAPVGRADAHGLAVEAGRLLHARPGRLSVALGDDARLEAELAYRREWPPRAWGAQGPAQAVPWLGQYWSPYLLEARVRGRAVVGGRTLDLSGAAAYGEKNWGDAFAGRWWWGQAPLGEGAGVAFAGGRLRRAGLTVSPTALALWTPAGVLRLAPPAARTVLAAGGGAWRLRARSPRWSVEVEGESATPPLRLSVPIPAERRTEVRASHHLSGRLAVTVRRGRRVWLRAESPAAALEDGHPGEPG